MNTTNDVPLSTDKIFIRIVRPMFSDERDDVAAAGAITANNRLYKDWRKF